MREKSTLARRFKLRKPSRPARMFRTGGNDPSPASPASPARVETLETRTLLTATLATSTDFSGITSPHGIVTGAFVNGGAPDVAVAGTDPNTGLPTVAVYLNGQATPIFNDLPAGSSAFDLAVADFNQDKNLDIVVTDPVDATVSVLLGNGNGTFQPPITTQYGTPQPASSSPVAYVAAADFTSDSMPDLAVTDPADHQIVILLGNGNGTFSTAAPVTINEADFDPEYIDAADFSGAGNNDIAFNDGTNPDLYVAVGNGNGTFAVPTPTHVTGPIQGIASADLTGDGSQDCVVSVSFGGQSPTDIVDVLLNTGGTFAAPEPLSTTFEDPGPIVIADVNGDGLLDIVTMNPSGALDYFQGNGTGSFNPAIAYAPTTGSPQAIATADVNGDGKADILFSETNPALAGGGGYGQILGGITPSLSVQLSGTLPASAISGQKAKIAQQVSLDNISSATVDGSATVQFVLSTGQTDNTGDAVLSTITKKVALKVNKGQLLHLNVTKLPAVMTPGLYYVVAQVTDPDGATFDAASTAEISIAAATIDLSGSFRLTGTFKNPSPTAAPGKRLNVSITLTNSGNVTADGILPIVADTSIDNTLNSNAVAAMSYHPRIAIKPGKSITFALSRLIAPAAAGSYYLIVQLDPNDTLGA